MQKFEKLLDKLIKEGKLDKVDLFRKLGLKSGGNDGVGASSQLIANSVHSSQPKGLNNNNILEERESSQSNDMLLDEQIMGEEESLDEDRIITDDDHVASEA